MNVLKDLFSRKKFLVSLTGVLAEVFVFAFSGLPEETAATLGGYIVAIVSSYVLGQGIADHGKERAKIEAQNGSGK